jgi:hypothetical protein
LFFFFVVYLIFVVLFGSYASYTQNHLFALETLNDMEKQPIFADFLASNSKLLEGLNLRAYLIMPCQR